ncbi:Fic family protein [Bacteroides graminisolvens]|uniref:Fic family protein n=1 Tax=Bacteroides graminisolvens TaxID=477666 RepID=UPI00240A925E|nr:Fic family protein [Bacteroides graminisolvens]
MAKNKSLANVMEIVMATSDKSLSQQRTSMIKKGLLRKIAPKIYTTNLEDEPDVIIRRNVFYIIGQLYPQAVISHRSAYELKPTADGDIYLTYSYSKNISLPGLTVHLMEGPKGTEHDMPFIENLYISSLERRTLENLQKGRARGKSSKCLPRTSIEEFLERMLQVNGESGLNAFRDKARVVSKELDMKEEFETLNHIIGAILSTKPSGILTSASAQARAQGEPYDSERIRLFGVLFEALHNSHLPLIDEPNVENAAFRNFAFFESYFSNYIEGTEFEIEDARTIIETGQPLPDRNADSHDVLGTFQLVASRREMRRTPSSSDELIELLQDRHRILMAARPDRNPGMFKMQNNHAGDTHFVDCTLVRGTLRKGYEFYQALEHPFAKALYMMFMISEVHPFNDGNGRISRIMMNSELVAADQSKIIIPTVFREDYLNALRRLTRKGDPSVVIRALSRVRQFSANITGDNFEVTRKYLESCNAFKDGDGYILRF